MNRRGYSGWVNGDFNYDNVIDEADYLLIDRVFAEQSGVLDASLLAQRESKFGTGYVSALVASVPEPVSLAWIASCGLLARRRRTR